MKGLAGLLKEIKAFKEIYFELKDIYPEIASLIQSISVSRPKSADVKQIIQFAVSKIVNDPYIVLGARKDDPPELIDAVYKLKAKYYHPDNKKTGNKEKFIKINKAYEEITNGNR